MVGATAALAPAHHLSHPFIAPTGTGAVAAAGPGRDDDDMRQMVICFVSHAPVAECFGGAPAQTHTHHTRLGLIIKFGLRVLPNLLPDHRCETTSIINGKYFEIVSLFVRGLYSEYFALRSEDESVDRLRGFYSMAPMALLLPPPRIACTFTPAAAVLTIHPGAPRASRR